MENEQLDGQLSIFDYPGIVPEERKPLLDRVNCEYYSKYYCDRWHGGDEYIKLCKKKLISGFQCTGCCHFCIQAPQNNGKCLFECRTEI